MTTINITFEGTISPYVFSSTPGHYVFAPTSLSGLPFTVNWQFDYLGTFPDGNPIPIPTLIGSITVNGITHNTSGLTDFPPTISNHSFASQSFLQIFSHEGLDTFVITNTSAIPLNLQPFHYTFNPLTDNMQWDHQIGGGFNLDGLSGLI